MKNRFETKENAKLRKHFKRCVHCSKWKEKKQVYHHTSIYLSSFLSQFNWKLAAERAHTHTVLLLLISLYQCAWSSESSKMWNNLMKLVAQFSAQFPQPITSNPIETDHFPNWFIFPDVFLHSFSHIVWRFFNVRRRNKTLVY